MSELIVENLDPAEVDIVTGEGAPEEAPEPEERAPVAFQTGGGEEVNFEAAPKKRGRPKAEPKPEPKPRAEPKKRGRPPKPREEPVPEAVVEPPPPIDLHALMQPLVEHYINQSHARREGARRQRYDGLFQNMLQRRGASF